MEIPQGTPSLLLTLLEGLKSDAPQELKSDASTYFNALGIDPGIAPAVQQNIDAVVEALKPMPFRRNLTKDVAQRKLYEVLYEAIERGYEEPDEEPTSDQMTLDAREQARTLNRALTSAIGRALERAINGELKDLPQVKTLREELRKKIIEALTPKPL
jgi:hypothetical protein